MTTIALNSDETVCADTVFRRLYKAHAKHLRNFAYYRCGDLQQAEDIAHESLLRLWQNCAKVLVAKAKSYLYTTAQRLLIDQSRHHQVKLAFERKPEIQQPQTPEQELLEKEFEQRLTEAVGRLAPTQREAFLMNRVDEMTYTEIADTLGITVKAVEKRMHLALQQLKNELSELRLHKI